MPRSMHLHSEIYPNLKSISDLFKMYMKSIDSLYHAIIESRAIMQTFGCLRLYGDSRVSRAQSRINAYQRLLLHDWLFIFSTHNRFAETHSHLQLSYIAFWRPVIIPSWPILFLAGFMGISRTMEEL